MKAATVTVAVHWQDFLQGSFNREINDSTY